MEDATPESQPAPAKPRRGQPAEIASSLLIVALRLVNEKMGQIRQAGFASYMGRDLPDLRAAIVNMLKERGEWDGELDDA